MGRALGGLNWLKARVSHQSDECLTWPLACDNHGYGIVGAGNGRVRKAHRVMCELAHGPCPPGHEAAHSCGRGNKGCVNPRHLSWKTRSENAFDTVRHGRHGRAGKVTVRYKLTPEQVSEIRALKGRLTQIELGLIYGVSHRNIGKILRGVTWRKVAA